MGNLLNMGIKMQAIATTTTTTTAVTVYTYLGRATPDAASSAIACSTYATVRGYQSLRSTLASIIVGDVIYDTYPTPTNGGDNWIALKSGGFGDAYSFQINSSGVVTSVGGICGATTTTTSTTILSNPTLTINWTDVPIGGAVDVYKNGVYYGSPTSGVAFNVPIVAGDTFYITIIPAFGGDGSYDYYVNAGLIASGFNIVEFSSATYTASGSNIYTFDVVTSIPT
jgi:hypothetical protein